MTSKQMYVGSLTGSDQSDQVVRALADEQRRHVLGILEAAETPLALADIAIELAQRETGEAESDSMFETARQIRLRLHHGHLPKLAEADLIDYDIEKGLVALPDDAERTTVADRLKP